MPSLILLDAAQYDSEESLETTTNNCESREHDYDINSVAREVHSWFQVANHERTLRLPQTVVHRSCVESVDQEDPCRDA